MMFQLGKEWFPRLRSSFMAGAKRSQVIESAKLQSGTILAAMELDPNYRGWSFRVPIQIVGYGELLNFAYNLLINYVHFLLSN